MPPGPRHLNIPAERARHNLKREPLPGVGDEGGFTLTGPITLTVTRGTEPESTTTSAAEVRTSVLFTTKGVPESSSTPTTVSPSLETTSEISSPISSSVVPTPSASVITPPSPPPSADNAQSGAISSPSIPGGAIAGIVVAVVLISFGIALFFRRQRLMKKRSSRRLDWLGKPVVTPYSFSNNEKAPFSNVTTTTPISTQRPTSGIQFARAQARVLSGAPPLPTLPGASYLNSDSAIPIDSALIKSTFVPSLPDELSIVTGETVKILQEFDDGWAMCMNGTGDQGMVPLECLHRSGAEVGKRESTL